MKKQMVLLFMLSIYTMSLSAYNNRLNESILKYNQIKKDNYIKILSQKRDLTVDKRDARDLVRKYQELRVSRR